MASSLGTKPYDKKNSPLLTCSLSSSVASEENCFKILITLSNVDIFTLFDSDDTMRTRNNGIKLKCRQANSDRTKIFFNNVVTREWNKLPPAVVQRSTIDSFKASWAAAAFSLTFTDDAQVLAAL